ncbi:MAG TPA: hypothetical protein VNA26_09910, partial [Chitinophagaceae bacterium]|nr:hypothetical protein [Chitinophagaceae bacterium]
MKSNLLLIAGVILLFNSCAKTPEACINSDKETAKVNEAITFTSCSKDADEHSFTTTSSEMEVLDGGNPCEHNFITVRFKSAGTYTITLRARNRIKGSCNDGTTR